MVGDGITSPVRFLRQSDYSNFLLFPLGAGLIRGVCVYVTVCVVTSLIFRMLLRVRGLLRSKYRPLQPTSQSKGERAEKGEWMAEVAERGDSVLDHTGEGGIRRRPSREEVGAEEGYVKGEGGTADVVGLSFSFSLLGQLQEQELCSVEAVDGVDEGLEPPEVFSPATGLAIDFKKSV
jgi:hypothetical protein